MSRQELSELEMDALREKVAAEDAEAHLVALVSLVRAGHKLRPGKWVTISRPGYVERQLKPSAAMIREVQHRVQAEE